MEKVTQAFAQLEQYLIAEDVHDFACDGCDSDLEDKNQWHAHWTLDLDYCQECWESQNFDPAEYYIVNADAENHYVVCSEPIGQAVGRPSVLDLGPGSGPHQQLPPEVSPLFDEWATLLPELKSLDPGIGPLRDWLLVKFREEKLFLNCCDGRWGILRHKFGALGFRLLPEEPRCQFSSSATHIKSIGAAPQII